MSIIRQNKIIISENSQKRNNDKNNNSLLPNLHSINPKWYKITYEDYKSGNINKTPEISKLKKVESSYNVIKNKKKYIYPY